jgi:hypothetical protein
VRGIPGPTLAASCVLLQGPSTGHHHHHLHYHIIIRFKMEPSPNEIPNYIIWTTSFTLPNRAPSRMMVKYHTWRLEVQQYFESRTHCRYLPKLLAGIFCIFLAKVCAFTYNANKIEKVHSTLKFQRCSLPTVRTMTPAGQPRKYQMQQWYQMSLTTIWSKLIAVTLSSKVIVVKVWWKTRRTDRHRRTKNIKFPLRLTITSRRRIWEWM